VRASAEVSPDGVAVRFSVALIHLQSGRVLWFGVVQGDAREADDPRGLASAVDRLARALFWYAGG
jgi:hypothetical protein